MNKMIDLRLGDCLEVMKDISNESIDLVITSPPYDDLRDYNSNLDFESIIKELFRIIKDGGIVVWNVNDKINKGSKSLTSFKQAIMFVNNGFNLNDTMIWKKSNPMPQVKQPRYNQCFEYMFIFSKGKPKTFNPIMVDCKSADKEYKSTCKKITKNKKRIYKEFKINKQKVEDNIWEFAVSQNKTKHPAVFPIELPLRHIKSWSNENDTVLDCFMGSGTTGIACKQLNRNFIGIELDETYYNIAKERIENTKTQ
jgi:DNA modification methylase